jgi:histone H3/H4
MTRFQTREEEKRKTNTKNDVVYALSEASKFT